VPDKPIAVAKE